MIHPHLMKLKMGTSHELRLKMIVLFKMEFSIQILLINARLGFRIGRVE